jgi:membrane peptidoglycan carboxypeptidase
MRWTWRAVAAVAALAVAGGAAFAVLRAVTPSVTGAPALVRRVLAENHAPSDGGRIPARVAAALLATEDSRYYSDPALDPRGTVRGIWGIVAHRPAEGGATIEMQLAKRLYTPRSGLASEVEQVALAFKLDARFTKKQILAMYLNAAYFGDGAYGVTAAAERYFGVPPADLSWGQAALIAGLVQAPSAYDPHTHLTLALRRRSHVLARLVATHTLTPAQAAAAARAPLHPAVSFGDR